MSETNVLFTKKWIEQLPPNALNSPSREKEYSDTQVVGLKLLVNKTGRKFFYLRYTINRRKRGIKIGEFGIMSLIEARQKSTELKAQIQRGIDPQEEKQQLSQIPLFREFVLDSYLPWAYANKISADSDESKIRIHLLPVFGNVRIDQINAQSLQRYIDQLKLTHTPATCNRHLSLLSRLLKMAVQFGMIAKNPAVGIRKAQENNERHRFLSGDEIARFLDALAKDENPIAAAFLEFLLYTGVRRSEALNAKWENVDMFKKVWFIPRSKNGKHRHVILNAKALELLKRLQHINPYLFPGKLEGKPLNNPQKCFIRTLERAGIKDFRIHDLRHTHASIAINNGASLYEVQHLLGHSQTKTTSRYAHLADETLRRVSDGVSSAIVDAIR
ncbi:MAG: tyrosine-type recombinase/integrase [Methylococcales bacterium]|nr:tyrosine-type recombinase/integrase [Methylococcales bacterium]